MKKIHLVHLFIILASFSFTDLTAQTYRYLSTFNTDGVPNNLVQPRDVISTQFLERINASLPERYPVPTYHPEYLSGVDTDIKLRQEADVWVTFVSEGAGYRNVLGFFTYSLDSPTVVRPTAITIAFPNVSASGSGGGLKTGDKVLLGRFPANTGISWVLIADGFRSGQVTAGNWTLYSRPEFNPEPTAAQRIHNVLLRDSTGVIVLSFEDIRRDNSGCDQDFNDAIFYVTTNPPTAINTSNINVTSGTSSETGSGGNGGLESNGDLASAIAKRNFQRQRTPSVSKENMPRFEPQRNIFLRGDNDLDQFIPQSPFENTLALVSTPTDLTKITNAKHVLSVDYLIDNQRKAAILATKTEGDVYEHTKAICDRLKGAVLSDVRLMELEGIMMPMYILQDEKGNSEYALSFSVIRTGDSIRFESHWTVEEFGKQNTFYNFQIWSKTSLWTLQTATEVLNLFKNKLLINPNAASTSTRLPKVFVKKGAYENNKLKLTVKNEVAAKSLILRGRKTRTETSSPEPFELQVALNGTTEQTVEVAIGAVFDAGFRLLNEKDDQADALYLADGAWGTDYDKVTAQVEKFDIKEGETKLSDINTLPIRRNVQAKGTLKSNGYISIFRSLRNSGGLIDVSAFKNVAFEAQGKGILEITLVKASIKNWADQYRTEITLDEMQRTFTLPLSSFTNNQGKTLVMDDATTLVFTLRNAETTAQAFDISISNVRFDKMQFDNRRLNAAFLAVPTVTTTYTTLNFSLEERSQVLIEVFAVATGQRVFTQNQVFAKGPNQVFIDLSSFSNGVYMTQMTQAKGRAIVKIVKQ